MPAPMEDTHTLTNASFILQAGEGTAVRAPGAGMWIKVRGEDTGGAFAVVGAVVPPVIGGPPRHINTRKDKHLYILDGALLF